MSEELAKELTGISLKTKCWSTERAVNSGERDEIAHALGAKTRVVKARKSLIDTTHPAWRRCTAIISAARTYWRQRSMDYVVEGVRVVPRTLVREVEGYINGELGSMLDAALLNLDSHREEILQAAKADMNGLYDESLYPKSWLGELSVEARERSIEPPSYLMLSNAEEYKRQLAQSVADISQGLAHFERSLWRELGQLSLRLSAMLDDDGRMSKANVANFSKLFDKVASLNFQGSTVFKEALAEAKDILDGVSVEELKKARGLRVEVKAKVDGMVGRFSELRQAVEAPLAEEAAAQ